MIIPLLAAIKGLTFTPDLYKCGVDIVGKKNVELTMTVLNKVFTDLICITCQVHPISRLY